MDLIVSAKALINREQVSGQQEKLTMKARPKFYQEYILQHCPCNVYSKSGFPTY